MMMSYVSSSCAPQPARTHPHQDHVLGDLRRPVLCQLEVVNFSEGEAEMESPRGPEKRQKLT